MTFPPSPRRRRPSSRAEFQQAAAVDQPGFSPGDSWFAVAQAVAIVALCVIALWPAMPGGFVWDDADVITKGVVRSPHALREIWWSTNTPDYWPVAYTSLWLDWQLWQEWATPYRVENLILHALNALLVWRILARLQVPAAWLCAAVFAVHPVTVESVAWILQRKTLLAMTFALASLWTWLSYRESEKRGWNVAALVLFALGMLSKTSIVVWPVVLLICTWWQSRRLTRRDIMLSLPFFAVSAVFGAVGMWFQQTVAIGDVIVRDDVLLSRTLLAGRAVWFYLGKVLWPVDLSFVYPRWPLEPTGWQAWVPDVALLAVFAILVWQRRTWGAAGLAALGYFVLNLVPVLGLVDIYYMRYSLVADHWQYLALPGPIALVVGGIAYLAMRVPSQAARTPPSRMAEQHPNWLGWTVGAALLIALTWQSRAQAELYSGATNEALWRDTLLKNPDAWLAHNNLGLIYEAAERDTDAAAEFNQAIALAPEAAEPQFCLGHLLMERGATTEALAHLQRAVELNPRMATARQWYGEALALSDRPDDALAEFQKVLELRPGEPEAYFGMVRVFRRTNRHPDAVGSLREVVRLHPENAIAHAELAQELLAVKDDEAAIAELREALRRRSPRSEDADSIAWANNLAWLLATHRDPSRRNGGEALQWAQQACEATGHRRFDCLDTLAAAHAEAGQFEAAVRWSKQMIQLLKAQRASSAAEKAKLEELLAGAQARLELYQQGKPYHEE